MAGLFDDLVPGSAPADDDLFGDLIPQGAQRELPAGVAPNEAAGSGRGAAAGKTAGQEAALLAADASTKARRGTSRGVQPYGAGGQIDRTELRFEPSQAGGGRGMAPGKTAEQEAELVARSSGSQPYRDKREAIDDAVSRIAEGAPAQDVFGQFGGLGITQAEIEARGVELGTPGFMSDSRPVTVRPGALAGTMAPNEPDAIDGVANFGRRVAARSSQAFTGALASSGVIGPDQAATVLARDEKRIQAAMVGEELQRQLEVLGKVKEWGQVGPAIADNLTGTAVLLAESVAMSAPALAATMLRLPTVAMAGAVGVSSGSLEYGASLSEALSERGVTLLDVDRVAALLKDDGFMADVRERGAKRGLAIGVIDALTAGMAGKFIGPALAAVRAGEVAGRDAVRRVASGAIKELATQVAGGAGGEALAQELTGESKPLDIALEALAEGVSAPLEARSNIMAGRQAAELGSPDGMLGGALAADIAERDFQPGAIQGYAQRASDSRFYDPQFIDPQATVAPRAPRVEEMPTEPFTPEQTAAMAAESQARKQARELVEQQAAEAEKAAPEGETPAQVGIRGVQRGAIAADAENLLRQNAQGVASEAQAAQATAAQPTGDAVPARPAGGDGAAAAGSPVASIAERYTSARGRLFESAKAARSQATELRSTGLTEQADRLEARARQTELAAAELPVLEEPKDGPELRAFNRVADAFEELTGRRPVAYVDRSARASDGFFDIDSGQFLVNLHKPVRSVAFTTFHEFQHLVRERAKSGDAQAQRATQMLDQVWAMIPAEKKRSYAEGYLFRGRIDAGAMTVEQALADPVLKDEMLSDFMGGKADDAEFFRTLARKDPKTFGAFAQRWIDTLAKIVKSLLGRVTGGNKDIEVVAEALERSRLVAEKVLREWAAMNPKLAQQQGVSSTIADDEGTTDGQDRQQPETARRTPREPQPLPAGQPAARRSGRDDAPGRGSDGSLAQGQVPDPVRVSYGVAREGATTAVGYHYSRQDRDILVGAMHGTGLAGAEADRLANADPRLKQRVYFYLDRGTGINPEAGVGGRAHRVELRNLYDADEDALRLLRDSKGSNAFELAVVDAGFDGWLTRDAGPSGNAVLLGSHAVPVEKLGGQTKLQTGQPLRPAAARQLTAPERIAANQKLPAQTTGKRWREYISTTMPEEFAELQDSPVWDSDERMYRDELARALKQSMPVLSRRDNELGAFDPFANDEPVSESWDDDKTALRAELEDEMAQLQAPPPQRIKAPTEAALRSAGIMAESAYKPLSFTKDKRGSGAVTVLAPDGKEYVFEYSKDRADGFSTLPDFPRGNVGADMGSGYQSGISEPMAIETLGRTIASIDLFKRKFDLIDAVPQEAGQRVIAAWAGIAGKPGAFTFDGIGMALPSAPSRAALVQRLGEAIVGRTYEVEASPGNNRNWITLSLRDRRSGVESYAEIQAVEGADARVVLHTQDLEAGSGAGKAHYQVGLAAAAAMGLPTNADSAGLTGINSYRRTEQMLSAALRGGAPNIGQIGVGQRVYGWKAQPTTDTEREQNLLRLALAGARNAAELAPRAADLRYDPVADSFSWRNGADADGNAADYVRKALASKDARAFGLSRSTLARAAITQAAMNDELDLAAIDAIRVPVLYSAREADVYAEAAERRPINYKAIVGKRVEMRVLIAETGDEASVEIDAAQAARDIDDRIEAMLKLRECLTKGRR